MRRQLLAAAVLLAVSFCLGQPAKTVEFSYTDRYDNIDLDEIFRNDRLYRKYFNCLTGEGKCTPDGKALKDHIPEALMNGCEKCTPRQKKGSVKVLKHIMEKRPEDWRILEKIYDPDGMHRQRYSDVLKKGLRAELVTPPAPVQETTTALPTKAS